MREAFERFAKKLWPTVPLHKHEGKYIVHSLQDGWDFYAAGMERAAEIAVGHYTVWDEGVTAGNEIADAIRAEIKDQS